jgi:hypothetical protein
LLQVFVRYRRYAPALKFLTLVLFLYVATAFTVHIPWGQSFGAAFAWNRGVRSKQKLGLVAGNEGPPESDQVELDLLAPSIPAGPPFWNDFPRIYFAREEGLACASPA